MQESSQSGLSAGYKPFSYKLQTFKHAMELALPFEVDYFGAEEPWSSHSEILSHGANPLEGQ